MLAGTRSGHSNEQVHLQKQISALVCHLDLVWFTLWGWDWGQGLGFTLYGAKRLIVIIFLGLCLCSLLRGLLRQALLDLWQALWGLAGSFYKDFLPSLEQPSRNDIVMHIYPFTQVCNGIAIFNGLHQKPTTTPL